MFLLRPFITAVAVFAVISLTFSPAAADTEKDFTIDPDASCITSQCHATMGKKNYVHSVGIDPGNCSRCHFITVSGKHVFEPVPQDTGPLCARCHDAKITPPTGLADNPPIVMSVENEKFLHKPFAEGKCTSCHDSHESDYFSLLTAPFPSEPYATYTPGTYRLCTRNGCHEDFDSILESPRLLSGTQFRNGNLNLHYKHVNKKKGRTCFTCHRNHGSPNEKLIGSSFHFGTRTLTIEYTRTDTGGSCVTPCHQKGRYDRYEPVFNAIRSSPTPGKDATKEELDASRQQQPDKGVPGGTQQSE